MHIFLSILLFFCLSGYAHSEEWKQLFGLRGEWKFEIGDNLHRAEKNFDDSKWDKVHAPSPWEDEGFPGYDGYGWYRKHFRSTSAWQEKSLALHLGNIDDVDEVFLNGHRIGGTGGFPPLYQTAYSADRIYRFPSAFLSPNGDNIIAIRVYDQELSGGITRGNLGVYEDLDAIQIEIPFTAEWKFQQGDDMNRRKPDYNDKGWEKIFVPEYWESAGYPEYDGFGWYRVHFQVPKYYQNEKLIALLGKIDDFDETYLNGELIGKTGSMLSRERDIPGSNAYQQFRAYVIPPELLTLSGDNVLAIRVYDGFKDGGIYEGPIGIVTRETYRKWDHKEKRQNSKDINNFFDWLFR